MTTLGSKPPFDAEGTNDSSAGLWHNTTEQPDHGYLRQFFSKNLIIVQCKRVLCVFMCFQASDAEKSASPSYSPERGYWLTCQTNGIERNFPALYSFWVSQKSIIRSWRYWYGAVGEPIAEDRVFYFAWCDYKLVKGYIGMWTLGESSQIEKDMFFISHNSNY